MPKWQELLCAIEDQQPVMSVTGLTHNFYKYPARFSPSFARQIVLAFSSPGDLVFDPFMGGGTTLVEHVLSVVGVQARTLAVWLYS
jgi:DNA modification methylase